MKTLVIEREKWLRGEGGVSSLLRSSDGKMCCLGFLGVACGLSPNDLRDHVEPPFTDNPERWPAWLINEPDDGLTMHSETADCYALIDANDSTELTGAAREQKIAAIFAKHGVNVVFK